VLSIQAGFFWHALFTKADQTLSKTANIPWTVNNGTARMTTKTGTSAPQAQDLVR
jgi:hypothetical protein